MNGDQVAYILRILTTAYPEAHLTEPGAVMWAKYLAPFNFDDVDEAADRWIQSNDRFPHINQLLEVSRTVIRRRREDDWTRELGQAPETPAQRSQVAEMMAVTRKLLADMGKQRHWHGTPGVPCEVCGGMKS